MSVEESNLEYKTICSNCLNKLRRYYTFKVLAVPTQYKDHTCENCKEAYSNRYYVDVLSTDIKTARKKEIVSRLKSET